jgi:hypothetical protein
VRLLGVRVAGLHAAATETAHDSGRERAEATQAQLGLPV